MTVEIYPVVIEAYDNVSGVFTLKAVDEVAAEIEITTVVNPHNWPEISEAIMKSLQLMFPPRDQNDRC
jgi:hypothetical protein